MALHPGFAAVPVPAQPALGDPFDHVVLGLDDPILFWTQSIGELGQRLFGDRSAARRDVARLSALYYAT